MRRMNQRSAAAGRAALALGAGVALASAAPHAGDTGAKPSFAEPVRVTAADGPIETEAPGYASPAWHDVDGDGRMDLVVGQFADGKMALYRGLEDGNLGAKEWVMAGGDVAEVPGVW